ncbi:MAG: FAD-binding oxidoreductase [Candidatus Thermoplasmatota archaeon]|nr:FAD-binding oxidoreductase [Candidatus Thermoplasmatota archaeon]
MPHIVTITDPAELKAYAKDMSRYSMMPRAAFVPGSEEDVLQALEYARSEGMPVTCRGAGSNLSGSAVGPGLILDFRGMGRILSLDRDRAIVEPGIVYDRVNDASIPEGYFLPYHVSSSKYCTIGGNVGTKASGLRSIKYGTVDTSLESIRFVNPVYGIVDTSNSIPEQLGKAIESLRKDLLEDEGAMEILVRRSSLKTSSGYNLMAFLEHERPRDIVTHLMVGSIGTLGIFTRICLRLVPVPEKREMIAAFFRSASHACEAVPSLKGLCPSLLELMDGFGTGIVRERASFSVPEDAGATLLVEFDSLIDKSMPLALEILDSMTLSHRVLRSQEEADEVWGLRWSMLLRMKRENEGANRRYVSFVDDLGVPVENLPGFIDEITSIFGSEGVPLIIYGHVGEGNLHLRPLIDRENWKEKVEDLADRCFEAAFRYGGTIAAEHGSGRNRAAFIEKEWGPRIYSYFRRVKEIFDPEDVLNPGTMFSDRSITDDLEF